MKTIVVVLGLLLSVFGVMYANRAVLSSLPFEVQKWHEARQGKPNLNFTPRMLGDLMSNHLSIGMTLENVTNLLGHPEIRTPLHNGVRIRGEFLEQIVYVYVPRMHNGWLVKGTEPLVLYFGPSGEGLKEWSPLSVAVQPISAVDSEATHSAASTGRLPLGNLRVAGRANQFDIILGTPDEKRTEYQLNYFLGKQSRLAWDDVFLELHFDQNKKLERMARSEH